MTIVVRDAAYEYTSGVRALDGVSLSIAPGESVALVGENGAGKTTLAKLLNGLLRPLVGSVEVDGHDTRTRTTAQLSRHVAFVFQNPDDQLFARTVQAEVAFGPRNMKLPAAEVEARVAQAMADAGIAEEAEHHPYDLAVPQRKLVAIAAALAMRTPAIILDEPTIGQDAHGIRRLGALVERLHAEGRTLIAITHDLDFCLAHFERVVVMAGGRILADGPASEVLNQTDLLAQAQVEPPQLVQLALALGWREVPRSPAEFADLYAERKARS